MREIQFRSSFKDVRNVKRLDFNKTLKVARYGVMKSEAPDQPRTRKLKDNSCTSMTELI